MPHEDEEALKKAVAHQPVATAIQANERQFQLYVGGVLTEECGTALDHGVLIAGCVPAHVLATSLAACVCACASFVACHAHSASDVSRRSRKLFSGIVRMLHEGVVINNARFNVRSSSMLSAPRAYKV